MPERQIDTFMTEVDKPEQPEEQPEDIAQPDLDLQPLAGIDVSIAKPKANFTAGGSFFRDGEYIPLFKVQPIYPRRAQERGTQGYAIVAFTITDSGSVENAKSLEGYCGDPQGPQEEMRPCTIFNSASARAALKLKYKPKIVDGKATSVEGVLHRFTFIMAQDD
jgi:protein TonB